MVSNIPRLRGSYPPKNMMSHYRKQQIS